MKTLLNGYKLIGQSIANLFKSNQTLNDKQAIKSDAEKLQSDWQRVGQDMRNAMNYYKNNK